MAASQKKYAADIYHMLSSIVFVFVLVFLIDQVTDILSSKESIEKYHDMKGEK